MLTNLKLQRMARYPKAKEFAKRLGVDSGYYSRLENGLIKKPKPEVRKKIAEILTIDEKVLFGG